MWLILFIGSLITSTTSGLYTPICAEGGLPVCATNGLAYLYFENECRLTVYIYKQIYLGQRVPIKTDLENCLLNCHEIVCPIKFKPVCAQQVPNGPVRTIPNACLVNQLICATKRHWKVIGEGLCAPTLNSKSLTGEEYSFTSPSSEDYLAYNSEPSLTPYVESSSYSGQEYSSPPPSPCTDQDQSENYMAPAPPFVSYAIPDTVPVPSTYEVPTIQPTLRSAWASDPLAYIAPDRSQSYEAHTPAPYGRLDQSQNYLPHAVPAPVPDLYPYAAPTPYVTLDQTQNYGTPAEAPKSYPVPELIPSPAPYEEQQPYLYPAPMPSVVSAPYTPFDNSPNFVVPAPVPGAYLGQDFVPAPYIPVRYTPVSASYQAPYPIANPVPASAPTPCSSLDQGQNYTAIVTGPASYAAQNAMLYPYEAEKTAPYPNAAVSSPSTQVHSAISAPPPISYLYDVQQTAPYPDPYSVPADLQYTIPDHSQGYPATPTSASYTNIERTPAYQAQLPAACSCTARHATNTPVYPVPNQYTKTVASSTILSNIYSRLPGSLDLTNLFKQLRMRFKMFIYRPSYTHIIITN